MYAEKNCLQRPWRISPKLFVMSVWIYTGDGKPTESEDTTVGGKWISVVKQRSETTETEGTQARKRRHIAIKRTKETGTENYKSPPGVQRSDVVLPVSNRPPHLVSLVPHPRPHPHAPPTLSPPVPTHAVNPPYHTPTTPHSASAHTSLGVQQPCRAVSKYSGQTRRTWRKSSG